MKLPWKYFLGVLFCTLVLNTSANNLQITNVTVNQSTLGNGTVSFNIAWNNAWNFSSTGGAPNNWDAVWVFVKFRLCSAATTTQFTHGQISNASGIYNSGGTYIPSSLQVMSTLSPSSGSSVITTLDDAAGLGIMLSPTASGASSTVTGSVTLPVTNLPASGTAVTTDVIGVEMVYVPNGPYNLGDGSTNASTTWSTYHFCTSAASAATANITSTNETATSSYFYTPTSSTMASYATNVPAAWPKGYYGFYCMKYEITQDLYVQFLNTIGSTAASTRYPGNTSSNRNTVSLQTLSTYVTTRPDRAQNWLSWADYEALLDWSALRPMTELEYEKACRGGTSSTANTAIVDEYPWQSQQILQATTLSGTENGTETFNTGNCLFGSPTIINGDGGQGPVRAGIFATANSGQITAGATFYGIMEMGGNIREYVVQMATNVAADTMTRNLGDGVLQSSSGTFGGGTLNIGDANVSTWPQPNTGPPATVAIGASCYGNRGGDWNAGATYVQTSDRQYCYYSSTTYLNTGRISVSGGRGIR